MITDIDLILEQIRVANGADLTLRQEDVRFHGHAIECRINAENPVSFRPSPGKIVHYHPPGGLGVRVDSAVYQGYSIPPYYDSLLGKLIVHGKTRGECLMRLRRALDEFVVDGIETTCRCSVRWCATRTSSTATITSTGWSSSSPRGRDGLAHQFGDGRVRLWI
jgi:acetyl-CoA carboxylase biotin carboxylase subunit